MTVLFQSPPNVSIPAGQSQRVFNVPANIKQPGQALQLVLTLGLSSFPNGSTSILIEFSDDGGVTFGPQGGGDTFVVPGPAGGHPPPPTTQMAFSLGADYVPTNARVTINSPSAFSMPLTVEAFSVPTLA